MGADGRRAQLVVRLGRVHNGTMKTSGDVCEYSALGSINEITGVGLRVQSYSGRGEIFLSLEARY